MTMSTINFQHQLLDCTFPVNELLTQVPSNLCGDTLDLHARSYHDASKRPRRVKGQSKAHFNRTKVANSTIMYSEAYTEYDESDIFDMLEAVSFDEDTMGAECELLALVDFDYPEGY